MHVLSSLVSLIEHFVQMHIVSHEFMLNGVATYGQFDRKLLRSYRDWLILEMYPATICFDFEETLSKSGKEGSFRKSGRQNRVIHESEIPIYEISIYDIKTCVIHVWNTCYQKEMSTKNSAEYITGISVRDSKAVRAFSDTVAELNLQQLIILSWVALECGSMIKLTLCQVSFMRKCHRNVLIWSPLLQHVDSKTFQYNVKSRPKSSSQRVLA